MAKGGKRSYTRDSNGRFASGGGKSGATKGGTLAARSSLKRSKAKNVPGASRQQAGAVTRAKGKLSSAMESSKRQGPAMAGVIRGKAANQVIRQAGKARAAAGYAAEAAAKKRGWNQDSQDAAFLRAAKKQRANLATRFAASGKKTAPKKAAKPTEPMAKKIAPAKAAPTKAAPKRTPNGSGGASVAAGRKAKEKWEMKRANQRFKKSPLPAGYSPKQTRKFRRVGNF